MAATLSAKRAAHRTASPSGRIVRSTRHAAKPLPTSTRSGRSGSSRRAVAPAAGPESAPARRPHLRLVTRPRVAINAALVLVGVVVALMLAAVVLHTRLAERQVEIDKVESAVSEARARFDVLRQQRAELRAPSRLAAAATEEGMLTSPAADFLSVDPLTVASILAASGPITEGEGSIRDGFEPLDQVRRVKAAAAGD